ncbi:MAG: lipid-binding protein [Chitinophagales bacterium]
MNRISLIFLILIAVASCKKKEFEPEKTATVNMSGEWWVQLFEDDDSTIIFNFTDIEGAMTTSNTSKNISTELLIDLTHVGLFFKKAIVPIDYASTSFITNKRIFDVIDSTETNTLIEGKIFKNATNSPSNHVTDSIRIVLETDDDPGVHYILKGYKDTGWPEDRHD